MLIVLSIYVVIVNRNSKNMTLRQKLLKAVYPAFMWITGKKANSYSNNQAHPEGEKSFTRKHRQQLRLYQPI
jgi:glutathione peroxidase